MYAKKILLFCVILSLPAFAHTDDDPARRAFDDGKEFYRNGDYKSAVEAFRKAYDIKPTWRLLYNIGQAEAADKRYGMALETFQAYLAEGGDQIDEDRQVSVRDEIERLRDMVGIIDVQTHDGAEIYIDGIKRGVAPIYGGVPVTAGTEHEIYALYNGEKVPAIRVKIISGTTVPVELLADSSSTKSAGVGARSDDVQEKEETASPTTSTEKGAKKLVIGGWATAGAGVVSLVAGAVTGGLVLSTEKELDANCDGSVCPEKYRDDSQTQSKLATASTVTLAVGATLLVGGTVMVILGKKSKREKLAAAPFIGPESGGATLWLSF
jgi:hypothetical protein